MSSPLHAGWETGPVGRHDETVVMPAITEQSAPLSPDPVPNPTDVPAKRKAPPVASSKRPARGAVVTYRHPDPITGGVLEGAGVVLSSGEDGAVTVAPLAQHYLEVDPENLAAADLSTED